MNDAFNVISLWGLGYGAGKFLISMIGVIAFGLWVAKREGSK